MTRADKREEEGGGWWTPDHSWLEMKAEEEDKEEIFYINSVITWKEHESKQAGNSGVSEDCTPPEQPSLMKKEKEEGKKRKVNAKRRPKQKRPGAAEAECEIMRKDAWL
jgi:hypothetical protein